MDPCNMILHYLKTALRNIRNNWVYTILSVCCLAIGTAMFSVLFYGINYDDFFENRLPGHNRSYFVYMQRPANIITDGKAQYRSQMPYSQYYDTLRGMSQVEMVSISGSISETLTFEDDHKVYCMGKMEGQYVEGDYFRYWNLTLMYGDRMPQNKNEIVVSQALLKRMGFDKDISQCIVTSEVRMFDTLQIVNVVRDDRWSRSFGADVYFHTSKMPTILPLYDIDVVLKEGVSVDEINSIISRYELKDFSKSGVMQLTRFGVNSDRKIKNMLLSLLSIIVLLVAVTNFLKHMIMVLKQRGRANIIRYSLGARQESLTLMLLAEVIVILIGSYAIACYLSFHICTWLNQAVYMGDRYFHLADLLKLNTWAIIGVGLVCAAVCRFAVYGQNRVMRNRIVAYQRESKLLKYIVICIESTVAVFALASVLVIAMTAPRPYNPLPKSVSDRTYFVETEEGHSGSDTQKEFYHEISRLPQVEEVVASGGGWYGIEFNEYIVGNGDRYFQQQMLFSGYDLRYFEFFNIPVEWLTPTPPSKGYLVDRKTYENYLKNNVDMNSIGKMNGSDIIPVQFVGVFDELMCGNPVVINGEVAVGFSYVDYQGDDRLATNFFVRFRNGVSKSEAEALVLKTWKEVNPSAIEEPKLRSIPKYSDEDMRFTALGFQIGGIVCMLLVILSVTSSISAETNIRRKEVALRKINGAKQMNIVGLFIRPYCIILALAFPIGILASMVLIGKTTDIEGFRSTYVWIAPLTLIVVALVIALSILRKIRVIMRTNPADVIKSE